MATKKQQKSGWAEVFESAMVIGAFLFTFWLGYTNGHEVTVSASCDGVQIEYVTVGDEINIDC